MMIQISKVIFFLLLISLIYSSCTTNGGEKDEIYIRIKNQTGASITTLWLGNLSIKTGSYSSKSYQSIFKNIAANSVSDYKQTRGKSSGYHRGNFIMDNGQQGFIRPAEIASAIKKSGIKLVNPSTGEENNRPTLPDGKYTFVIKSKGSESNDYQVIIQKD